MYLLESPTICLRSKPVRIISVTAYIPIRITTVSNPPYNCEFPNANRIAPSTGAIPTKDNAIPNSPAKIPLISDFPERLEMIVNANNAIEKYSAEVNAKVTLAR